MFVFHTGNKLHNISNRVELRHNEDFLQGAVSQSTRKAYKAHWTLWMGYMISRGADPFMQGHNKDVVVAYLTSFVRVMCEGGRYSRTVLPAIAFHWGCHGVDSTVFSDPRIRLLRRRSSVAGNARETSQLIGMRQQLPVTYDMLQRLRNNRMERGCTAAKWEGQVVYLFCALAFHFTMRSSELMKTSANHWLRTEDIQFVTGGGETPVRLTAQDVRNSTTKPYIVRCLITAWSTKTRSRGKYLTLDRTTVAESQLLDDLLNWVRISATRDDEPVLSIRKDGTLNVMTRGMASFAIKRCAASFGMPSQYFSLHSLRRGGAAAAKSAGIPRDEMKRVGDWSANSDNDLVYTTAVRDRGALAVADHSGLMTARDVAWTLPPTVQISGSSAGLVGQKHRRKVAFQIVEETGAYGRKNKTMDHKLVV